MKRALAAWALALAISPILAACGGTHPKVCSVYDASRRGICGACAAMPTECPFGHHDPEGE